MLGSIKSEKRIMPIKIDIEDFGEFSIEYLVMDLNGTIATQGKIDPSIIPLIIQLKSKLEIYLLSSDTFGTGTKIAGELGIHLHLVKNKINGAEEKANFVQKLGNEHVVAIGNGRNDYKMLKNAKIGIAILGAEGAAREAILNADIIVTSACDALNLLLYPQTMRATLRG